ncbi:hypothetical protein NQ314_001194 [Rhamnusium bicolor]|uniref:endo-polygalacturonase n=1 Tax=Rhamnusium bicolor TaxID=1586634 RepID=A0AAV8ZTG3_9CUCU|nr:hypothetical protein NQ314_001194 [Rhamnusium bicolor]
MIYHFNEAMRPSGLFVFLAIFVSAFAEPSPECIVTSFSQVMDITMNCIDIIVRNLTVPAGNTVHFHLKDGASVTFEGTTTFEYFQWPEWGNYLMQFHGNNVNVEGAPDGVTITDWNIDCSYGDGRGGHNTDGFDVISARNVVIKDSTVVNQDDCVAVNQGFNMHFSGLYCNGSHGISLSVGFSKTSHFDNTVRNVTYSNCTVVNSINAIHIKTHNDGGPGVISDVTYENIRFSDIINFGISIQEDYADGGSTGIVKGNVPIVNLIFRDIKGTLSETSTNSTAVYIFCADNGCLDWTWSDISIPAGVIRSWCNFQPKGYTC